MGTLQDRDPVSRVEVVSLLAKPSPAQDFELRPKDVLPAEVGKLVRSWLQAHMDSGNEHSVTLLNAAGHRWLLRAALESATDNAGRALAHMVVSRVAEELSPEGLTRLLFGAYRQELPARDASGRCDIDLAPVTPENPELIRQALVTLAVGGAQQAVVDNGTSAARVLEVLGERHVVYVTLMRHCLPARWPPGNGIVVSQAPWKPPKAVEQLVRSDAALLALDLGGLMDTGVSPQRRLALLMAAMEGTLEVATALENSELMWLAQTPTGRPLALGNMGREQVVSWLADGQIRAEELALVEDRLRPEDAEPVSRLLPEGHDGLRRFLSIFGPGTPGVERLLPPASREVWGRIRDPRAKLPETLHAGELQPLEEAGLLDTLSLGELAHLQKSSAGPWLETRWRAALIKEGMPEQVYSELCLGHRTLIAPPESRPAPEPRVGWLEGIDTDALMGAARWASSQLDWRKWWTEAVSEHPCLGPSRVPSLESPWTDITAWWVAGALSAGEVGSADLLAALTRWRRADGPSLSEQVQLLHCIGFTVGPSVEALLSGHVPQEPPLPEDRQVLSRLLQARVLRQDDVIEAVVGGASPGWLLIAGLDPASVALLDNSVASPAVPPVNWAPSLDPPLASAAMSPRFWEGFRGTLGIDLVKWLVERLEHQAGGAVALALLAAFTEDVRLALTDLKLIVDALPSRVLCRQAMAWAWDASRQREEALQVLLSAPGLRPGLSRWLRAELLSIEACIPEADLDVGEMMVLLPLLHPVRDVVRPVLSRTHEEPGEGELARALVGVIDRQRIPPPPPPDAATRRYHPTLIEQLARIPGWDRWKTSSTGLDNSNEERDD